jgi:pyrroline-5-carboxylate reductase
MSATSPTLVLVGCGKMGGALLAGWVAAGRASAAAPAIVVEPSTASIAAFQGNPAVTIVATAAELPVPLSPSVVVFAVKPQGMENVVPAYRRFARPGTVFLSIAAGKTLGFLAGHLGAEAAAVRSMPNTPAAIGRGITVACANTGVTAAQRAQCDALLAAVGEVAWVDDEALLDPVTAVSGSGPAYVFLLAECLEEAGVAAGLPRDLAARLARATVAGSGELLQRSPDAADQLRRNVTSPNGTTAAALDVLMAGEGGLQTLLTRAVAAASKRSRDLAG